jgi:hypothetical protein
MDSGQCAINPGRYVIYLAALKGRKDLGRLSV